MDIFGIATKLWRRRMQVATITFAFSCAGIAYALLATPKYKSQAVISPKTAPTGGGASALLSQLGGMGGMVASQLGIGLQGGPEKLELVLESTDLAIRVIERNNLLPKLFPKWWDGAAGKWKDRGPRNPVPDAKWGARVLQMGILRVDSDIKKGIVTVSATTWDSTFSMEIVRDYLTALNLKIKEDARSEADSNISYLQSQFERTYDPSVREKIQGLIAMEIDKATFLSSKGFDVIDRPRVSGLRESPKRGMLIVVFTMIGLFLSIAFVVARIGLSEFLAKRPD